MEDLCVLRSHITSQEIPKTIDIDTIVFEAQVLQQTVKLKYIPRDIRVYTFDRQATLK